MSDSESGSSDHDDPDHPTKGKRSRVAKACSGCKSSRRKCSGNHPCEHCIKRGINCVFDEDPPKKRGPKGSARALLEAQNSALRAEIERLKQVAFASGASTTSSGKLRKSSNKQQSSINNNNPHSHYSGTHGSSADNVSIGSQFTFGPSSQGYLPSSNTAVPYHSTTTINNYSNSVSTLPPVTLPLNSTPSGTSNPKIVIPDQLSVVSFRAPSESSYTNNNGTTQQPHLSSSSSFSTYPSHYYPHQHLPPDYAVVNHGTGGRITDNHNTNNKRKLNQITNSKKVSSSSSSSSSIGTYTTTQGYEEPTYSSNALSNPSSATLTSSSLTAESIWNIGPVVPTADEEQILQSFFDHSNKMLPAVDEESFYSALRDAAHLPTDDGTLSTDNKPAEDPLSIAANNLAKIALNSEAFGFRVLYHTVLCAGAKVQGRVRLAKNHYELARAFIGPCFSVPSQHLVSALLVMTMITRALCLDTNQSSLHAALALRMADLVPVTPEVRTVAVLMAYANCNGTAGNKTVAAPPPPSGRRIWNFEALKQQEELNSVHNNHGYGRERNIENDPHRRFADILGYTLNQLYYRFDSIRTPKEASDFIRLLEEAIEIQQGMNIMKNFPLRCLNAGITSIIYYRFGHSQLTMDKMAQAIRLAQADPLTRFSFPVITCIKEMLPLAKELIKIPELQQQEQSLNVRKNACQFLGSADTDIQTAAGVHYTRSLHCGDNETKSNDFQPYPLPKVKFDTDNDIPEEIKPKPDAPPGSSTITLLPAVLPALPLQSDGKNTCPTTGLTPSSVSSSGETKKNDSDCPTTGTKTDSEDKSTCPRSKTGGVVTEGVRICPKTGTVLDAGMALAASVMKGPGFDEPTSPPLITTDNHNNNSSYGERKNATKGIDTLKDASSRTVQTSTLARMTATLMPRRPAPNTLTTDSTVLPFLQQGTEIPLTCNSNIAIPALDNNTNNTSLSSAVPNNIRSPSSSSSQPFPPSVSVTSTSINHYHNPFSPTHAEYGNNSGNDFDSHTIHSKIMNETNDLSHSVVWNGGGGGGDDYFYRMVQDAYGDLSADFDRQPELLTPSTPASLSSSNNDPPTHVSRPSVNSITSISSSEKNPSMGRSSVTSSLSSSISSSTHQKALPPINLPSLSNTFAPQVGTPSLDGVKGRTLMDNFELIKESIVAVSSPGRNQNNGLLLSSSSSSSHNSLGLQIDSFLATIPGDIGY